MKMLPQRGLKMLLELFDDIVGCTRIQEKLGRKFEGHICNINLKKLKLVCLSLAVFWIWCLIQQFYVQKLLKNE